MRRAPTRGAPTAGNRHGWGCGGRLQEAGAEFVYSGRYPF